MSGRRVLVLYGSLLLGFAVVLCRLFWRRSWSWNLPAPPWITAGAGIPRHKGKRPQPQRADMARMYGDITESIRLR